MNKTYHTLRRDDGSVSVYYTVDGDPAHYVVFDTLDATPDLTAENARLREALAELVRAADPHTNMSDIPLLDALSLARAALAGGE